MTCGYDDLREVLTAGMPSDSGRWRARTTRTCGFPSTTEVEKAKRICQHCPVRRRCLAGALTRRPWAPPQGRKSCMTRPSHRVGYRTSNLSSTTTTTSDA